MNAWNRNRSSAPAERPRANRRGAVIGLHLVSAVLLVVMLSVGSFLATNVGRGYAQTTAPQSDEFNAPAFTAPFQMVCASHATLPCPDQQGSDTWSLDAGGSGYLRIWSRPGSLLGTTASGSNDARNLALQPFDPTSDWTATSRMTFPASGTAVAPVGQVAGLVIYQDDDNFLFVGRALPQNALPRIEFVREVAGQPESGFVTEGQSAPATVYLRLTKVGTQYQASFSYDNQTFTPVPPASSAGTSRYTSSYTAPRVGLFSFGGSASDTSLTVVPADFDWFHVSQPETPGTPTPTATPTATPKPATAQITVSPASGQPGTSVTASGSGFQAGEAITVTADFPLYNGNTLTVTRNATARGDGTFAGVAIPVPQGARQGPATVTATGATSHATGQAVVSVTYQPRLSATPSTAPPGGTISVTGQGFVANSVVNISLTTTSSGGAATTRTVSATADQQGQFTASLTLPAGTRPGTYTVSAVDTVGDLHASTTVTAALHPVVTVSASSVLPGHTVTVTGAGYSAGASVVVSAVFPLYGGGTKTVTRNVTTSGSGKFSVTLTAPARAAAGTVTLIARGPNGTAQTHLVIRPISPSVWLSSSAVLPGSTVTIYGAGFLPDAKVDITVPVRLTSGGSSSLALTVAANGQGGFSRKLHIPANVSAGTYTLRAHSELSGRAPTTRLVVAHLSPSLIIVPTMAAPGTQVTINGFGFAAGARVTVSFGGQSLGTAVAGASGQFSLKATIPANTASGSYTLTASSTGGRQATASLQVNRAVATHFYFAALYTGHQENLALFNPTGIRARVIIAYQLTTGVVRTKQVTIAPHTRMTENVNADLGPRVSTAAVVSADVPIVAERVAYRGSDGVVVPGTPSPATTWYFADGNTSHGYAEYIAIQNPNHQPAQVAVHIAPTHSHAFIRYRTVKPTSRLTLHLNSFVKDAVGVTVTSSLPVVVNRTIRIHHGITSKIGVRSPQSTWYFAGGVQNANARYWIGAMNPSDHSVYLTLHAYAPSGVEVGTVTGWLKANGRVGYLLNRIAHRTDVAVVVRASSPIVAEQTTYSAPNHDASTDTFGATVPASSWSFAAGNTIAARGDGDVLDLFNPGLTVIPVAVQFMSTTGEVINRTYLVGPLAHQRIDVGSVAPNRQLGIVAASSAPFVALNRYSFNHGLGADTSAGLPGTTG